MRISRKCLCTRTKEVLRGGKSIETTQKKKPQQSTKNDDPQIPQPDLRFASGKSEANSRKQPKHHKRGQSPNKNTHLIDLPWDAVACPLHHLSKTWLTAFQADMKALACELL